MNLTIDPKVLAERLRAAPACNATDAVPHDGEVREYLLEHYLTPFFGENVPTVGSLDFGAFTLEDADDFEDYLDKASKVCEKLVHVYAIYQQAAPVAQSRRAFC